MFILNQDLMVGDEAYKARSALCINYPIENGVIKSWDDMEHLWNYSFANKLGLSFDGSGTNNTKDKKILLTEASLNPKQNKEKMAEYMFEKYNFGYLQCQAQALLVLYAVGSQTGVVVDSGDGVTHIVVSFDGYMQDHLTSRLNIAGRHVSEYLNKLLQNRGYSFNMSNDFDILRDIKENYCYCAYDYNREVELYNETTVIMKDYILPDGKKIILGSERYESCEVLFHPDLIGLGSDGLSEMIFNTINQADIDLRMTLYKNIVLSGGTTMISGLADRLNNDINKLYLEKVLNGDKSRLNKLKCNIESLPNRNSLVYMGASVLGDALRSEDDVWISNKEYKENGSNIVFRKQLK